MMSVADQGGVRKFRIMYSKSPASASMPIAVPLCRVECRMATATSSRLYITLNPGSVAKNRNHLRA